MNTKTQEKLSVRFYISSGAKNAMYTLRRTNYYGNTQPLVSDYYVCNLSTDSVKAEEKAKAYVDAIIERSKDDGMTEYSFELCASFNLFERRGNLSVDDTLKIESIEDGIFPFGKYSGTKIEDAPESYVLFFADKASKDIDNQTPVESALFSACLGVALDKGYIESRINRKNEFHQQRMLSSFVGEIGERITINANITGVFEKVDSYSCNVYYVTELKEGDNIFTYIGNRIGKKGDIISLTAKVKAHSEYKDVKSTLISHPRIK